MKNYSSIFVIAPPSNYDTILTVLIRKNQKIIDKLTHLSHLISHYIGKQGRIASIYSNNEVQYMVL